MSTMSPKNNIQAIPKSRDTRLHQETIEDIYNAQDAEEIPAETRFFEDVNVGDELQPVVRGL